MSIATTDIKFYKAATSNNTDSNGGVISDTEITTNILNNLFPNVSHADRIAGVTRYRKMFMKNDYSGELQLRSPKIWIGSQSTAGDYFRLKLGTDTDIQSTADDYTDWAGAGTLGTTVSSGETTLVVNFDAASGVYDGALVHVDDGSSEEDLRVLTVGWSDAQATLTLSGETESAYTDTVTIVSTVLEPNDYEGVVTGWTEVSGSGTYDESTYPLTMYSQGSTSEYWTLTFDDASNFQVTGTLSGNVGSGDISADFSPPNGASYYFTLAMAGWGGTWANGDYITWTTSQAAQGVWVKEVVPAGAASASNSVRLDWAGESA